MGTYAIIGVVTNAKYNFQDEYSHARFLDARSQLFNSLRDSPGGFDENHVEKLGPAVKFPEELWMQVLEKKFDLSCYDVIIDEEGHGFELKIKEDILKNNIDGLIDIIQPLLNTKGWGSDIASQNRDENDYIANAIDTDFLLEIADRRVYCDSKIVPLLMEGKVQAETITGVSNLINFLFRNSSLDNVLKGCIIYDIV